MTLDEAIIHAREVAEEQLRRSGKCTVDDDMCDKFSSCLKCAEEHEQLAEWLEELKIYKESNISIKNYQQGRADGIDECIELIAKIMPDEPFLKNSKHYEIWKMKTTELRMLRGMLEQLKEQT